MPGEFVVPEVPVITTVQEKLACQCDEDQLYKPSNPCQSKTIWAWAEDAKGNKNASRLYSIIPPNQPPAVSVEPSGIEVIPGERVSTTVTATDPDGDTITLEKVSGPGILEAKGNAGKASGSYSWTAAGHDPWKLAVFEATDPCGAAGRSYLLIHVLQPPRAYDGHVTVPRKGTATTSLYIEDPDTPPDDLTVDFHPPAGISVHLLGVEEPPYYYGSYYGYTATVEVSVVDPTICGGTYDIPFTVTDSNGNSSSVTLVDLYKAVRKENVLAGNFSS